MAKLIKVLVTMKEPALVERMKEEQSGCGHEWVWSKCCIEHGNDLIDNVMLLLQKVYLLKHARSIKWLVLYTITEDHVYNCYNCQFVYVSSHYFKFINS